MQILIHTRDSNLASDLLGRSHVHAGDEIELDHGVSLTYKGSQVQRSFGLPEIVMLSVAIPTGIVAGIFANWLWEKLKNHSIVRIEIDRTTVEFEEGEIKRAIHERVTKTGN